MEVTISNALKTMGQHITRETDMIRRKAVPDWLLALRRESEVDSDAKECKHATITYKSVKDKLPLKGVDCADNYSIHNDYCKKALVYIIFQIAFNGIKQILQ